MTIPKVEAKFDYTCSVGGITETAKALQSMNNFADIYLIFTSNPTFDTSPIEHVGTLIHQRVWNHPNAEVESKFIMRNTNTDQTFGCCNCIEEKHMRVDKRIFLTYKLLEECSSHLAELGIQVKTMTPKTLNSTWIQAFEKAGYRVFHLKFNPNDNPLGMYSENESSKW